MDFIILQIGQLRLVVEGFWLSFKMPVIYTNGVDPDETPFCV